MALRSDQFHLFNLNPTDKALSQASIQEFCGTGTVVGALSTTDFDSGDTYPYSLLNDAGTRFAIAGKQLVVANGLLLDSSAPSRRRLHGSRTRRSAP